ncbi:hypothetical protein N752_23815 [Desulforamulus aquiferis]|nr:hypothetical protein [Desulforamulus aquiferis]RYD02685.1 hypothetical protein N752_23815 [Desulforamulus aquiferis]
MEQEIIQIKELAQENPFAKTLNIEVTELKQGESCIEITVGPNHLNPMGTFMGEYYQPWQMWPWHRYTNPGQSWGYS